jgi:hypothetical protein
MSWRSGPRLPAADRASRRPFAVTVRSSYPSHFQRDMACTEAEWLGWLPRALGAVAWERTGARLRASLEGGDLHIHWAPAPPRVMGLMRLPRLLVEFRFEGVDEVSRTRFMRHFDLTTQRGGG